MVADALATGSGIIAMTGRPPPEVHPHIATGSGFSTLNRSSFVVEPFPAHTTGSLRVMFGPRPEITSSVAPLCHASGAAGSLHEPYETEPRLGRRIPIAW